MTKITFEDLPSTNTPLSASNLNTMQDNIETAINTKADWSDTGWVDLTPYLNTTNFEVRSGYTPMVRKFNGVVYLRGAVYCSTAPNSNTANLFINIPAIFGASPEKTGAGVHYELGTPYKIWVEGGYIKVNEGANIQATSYYRGYSLSDINPYTTD